MRSYSKFLKLLLFIMLFGLIYGLSSNKVTIFKQAPTYDALSEYFKNEGLVEYQEEHLIIKVKNVKDIDNLRSKYDIDMTKLRGNLYLAKYSSNKYSMEEIMILLNNDILVEYAEPDYVLASTATPTTEPRFNQQWGLSNVNYGIDIMPLWSKLDDTNEVVVAVVDTGVDYNHPDLKDIIWHNSSEVVNGIDDDHNGYIDDNQGWNFAVGNNQVMDTNGHGTHIAGIIGASINDVGVAGINPNVKIMALNVLSGDGNYYLSDVMDAISYALNKGVKIFNFSFGGSTFVQSFRDMMAESNALFICAAGNGGLDEIGDDNDNIPFYPSSYDLDNIIAVGATDVTGHLAVFSNYGDVSVDIAAPGDFIMSTYPNNNYQYMSGTSMATPFVVGVTSILYSQNPTLDIMALKTNLLEGAKTWTTLNGKIAYSRMMDANNSYNILMGSITFDGGDGSLLNPYLISNADQLNAMRNNLAASYKLTSNIDLSNFYLNDAGWLPIGTVSNPFTGTFDGAGYEIRGLMINRSDTSYVGLFGYVKMGSKLVPNIYNVKIDATNIVALDYGASLIGYGENVYLKDITIKTNLNSSFSSVGYFGGLIGYAKDSILENVVTRGNIDVNGDYVGGIAGYLSGTINSSYSEATLSGNTYVGGLVGVLFGDANDIFSLGVIIERDLPSYFGGLIGYLDGSLENGYYSGYLQISDENINNTIGFIVGTSAEKTVNNTYYYNSYNLDITSYGTLLTGEQIYNSSSYVSFDFTNTWEMGTTSLLPTLKKVAFIPLTSFEVPTKMEIAINDENNQLIDIIKNPTTNIRNNYLFSSLDTNIVTVGSDGTLVPVSEGTTTVSVYSLELNETKNITVTVSHRIKGDLNGDTNVSTTDLVILRRYLAGMETVDEGLLSNGDINDDGNVTLTDLVKLRRFLAGLEEL